MRTEDTNKSYLWSRTVVLISLFVLLLTACSSSVPKTQALEGTSEPALPSQAGNHPPAILRVEDSEQVINGFLRIYKDIYFTDPDGDVTTATYTVISSSLGYPLSFPDFPVEISAAEQKGEALFPEITACWQKMELVYEVRLRDLAGNMSEPVLVSMSCATPQPVDTRQLLITGLSVLLVIGFLLLVLFWFLFRKRPSERVPALRSTILLVLVIMTVQFLQGVLHEGGHALYLLFNGVPVTLFVHPFFFSGFARPVIPASGVASDILGSATSLLVCLLITLPFWKRRSLALLPLVLLFPYSAMGDGFNVMGFFGDFYSVVQKTGAPAIPFLILGALLMCIGILSFFSLLPLAGLDPRDNKILFVLPAVMWLISALSLLVAHLFVPGSPINLEFFPGREILLSVNKFISLYIGIVLSLLYVSLFRWLYPRLPAWLHTDAVTLTWKDLRLPAILWAVCVVVGLIVIL